MQGHFPLLVSLRSQATTWIQRAGLLIGVALFTADVIAISCGGALLALLPVLRCTFRPLEQTGLPFWPVYKPEHNSSELQDC